MIVQLIKWNKTIEMKSLWSDKLMFESSHEEIYIFRVYYVLPKKLNVSAGLIFGRMIVLVASKITQCHIKNR